MRKTDQIDVSILCLTYNHAPYIERTLNSFLNQKVNFKYEILIHDDASIDGTQEIIKKYVDKYPNLFVTVFQEENMYSKGVNVSSKYLYPLIRGKYVATCEGDDFWPDLYKLQKQFDFLESHSDYTAITGVTEYYDDYGKKYTEQLPGQKYTNQDLNEWNYLNIKESNVGTNTYMGRADVFKDQKHLSAKKDSPRVGDVLLILRSIEMGKVFVSGDVFQYHTVQTRKNASNYNSLYGWEDRYKDVVLVISSIDKYFEKQHDLRKWYDGFAYNSFVDSIKNHRINNYLKLHSKLKFRYRVRVIRYVFTYIATGIKNRVKRIICKK